MLETDDSEIHPRKDSWNNEGASGDKGVVSVFYLLWPPRNSDERFLGGFLSAQSLRRTERTQPWTIWKMQSVSKK